MDRSRPSTEWITDSHAEGGGRLGIHADGVLVGDVMLRARPAGAVDGASAPAQVASLGYAVHPDHQGKGLAREAVGAVVQAGFERWGLHRIEARVFTGARPSSRLLADLGFTREGVLRQVVWSREGTWFDDEVWARLA